MEPDSRLVETHTATLLLLGDRVYKWKKPVFFGFVDFRTLEARRRACEAELALNRRLSPDVYLDLDVLVDGSGRPVEHLVVMRRLPEQARLSGLVQAGCDVSGPLRQLARLLADFHSRAELSSDPQAVAGVPRLRELWDVGLDALDGQESEVVDARKVAEARQLVHAFLDGRAALVADRIAGGYVRDGHGDLLADDIFCLPDGPRVLDCLDFDPLLRQGDVLGDVATLAMDLERLGSPRAAEQLISEYVEMANEHHPEALLHLYVAYRAQVRAKVALLRAEQTGDPAVRTAQQDQVSVLVRLMLEHLRRTPVRMVLVGGLPGSGKSTVAEGLAAQAGWVVLSSDLVRRELDLPPAERYTDANVQRVYDVLLARGRAALERGCSVVLDATWLDVDRRAAAQAVARQTRSVLVELQCCAGEAVADQRLARRSSGHPSDADAAVRRALERAAQPWPTAQVVDTSGPVAAAVAAALGTVEQVTERPEG